MHSFISLDLVHLPRRLQYKRLKRPLYVGRSHIVVKLQIPQIMDRPIIGNVFDISYHFPDAEIDGEQLGPIEMKTFVGVYPNF